MNKHTIEDIRFEFLVELGFDISEINNQLGVWCQGIIDSACDEYLISSYSENLKYIKSKNYDEEFILYLFFTHSDSFSISNNVFKERFEMVEKEIGYDCELRLKEDFWECGESKIFELVGWLTNDENEWSCEMRKEKEKMRRAEE